MNSHNLSLGRSLLIVILSLVLLGLAGRFADSGKMPDWDAQCDGGQPYSVVASYRAQSRSDRAPDTDAPSVLLIQDTPDDKTHYELASFNQIGTVWGLAYRHADHSVYAGAFHKRALPYGPSGPGGIYRIDLESGEARPFVTVPNAGTGGRRSAFSNDSRRVDLQAAKLVGKVGLGDVDISDDESQLYAVNLSDRHIYRYELPSGNLLGSFAVGSQSEAWHETGRPLALAFHAGKLYHGVVNERAGGADFIARIYRSDPDGSSIEAVATFDLGYSRDTIQLKSFTSGTAKWGPWTDISDPKPGDPPVRHVPQPMLTDIVFTEDGTMALSLRDRYIDQVVPWVKEEFETVTNSRVECHVQICTEIPPSPTPAIFYIAEEALGFGDVIRAKPTGDFFDVQTNPEYFDDTNEAGHSESAFGGLTCYVGTNRIAVTSFGVEQSTSSKIVGKEGVYWYDVSTGNKSGREVVGQPGSFRDYADLLKQRFLEALAHDGEPTINYTPVVKPYTHKTRLLYNRDLGSLGDIESLCVNCGILPTPTPLPPSDTPVPTDTSTTVPTAIPASETPTFTSTPTFSPVPPTLTSTPLPKPVYLPVALFERCDPGHARGDIILVIDTSSSMVGEKIQAARTAAHNFVNAMTLPQDQVGIVTFNATGSILSRLTGNGAVLHAAIDQISTAPGTRIDAGLDLAIQLLAGPERKASNTPVVIVMTDGLQSAEPERPQLLAAQLRSSGVVIYAIGLGSDVDAAYLTRLAGDVARMKLSPTAAELSAIYLEIARLIPCAPSSFWGGR